MPDKDGAPLTHLLKKNKERERESKGGDRERDVVFVY